MTSHTKALPAQLQRYMYVCIIVYVCRWMDGRMDGQTNKRMGWMDGRRKRWIDE